MSIQRRTVFYDIIDGVVRFHDWAIVTTTLGSMAEPFVMQQQINVDDESDYEDYDFTDMMHRIDDMRQMDSHKAKKQLGDNTIGGTLLPRVGP